MVTRKKNAARYKVLIEGKQVFIGTMTELKRSYCPHRLNYKMFTHVGHKIDFRDYSIERIS